MTITPLALLATLATQDVQLKTRDGQSIHAVTNAVHAAKRGVVLVHMEGRHAGDWQFLADRLEKNGVATVAVDLRGHGANGARDLAEADYRAMVGDVAAGVAWLARQGITEVSCIGASLGANLCVQAAAQDPGIANLVLLSPSINSKGVTTGEAIKTYGDRPVLLVASTDDAAARGAVAVLGAAAIGQKHVEILQNAGHGTRMLNQDAGLEGLVLSWVLGTYRLASGEIVTPKPAQAVPGEVVTSGRKLPSHAE